MARVLIIQNPVAGTQPAEEVTNALHSFFSKTEWDYHVHLTKKGEDISKLISSSVINGFDFFIAAGGDGTISSVASGLAAYKIPFGILPVGTGNGLARDLKIPLHLDRALELVYEKPAVKFIDAIEVGEKCYLLNLSVGFTPLALEQTDRDQKQKLGRMAYILAGLRSLAGVQPATFFLELDGEKMNFKASELLLLNSITIGDPGRYLKLGIENDDGILDLFIIQSKTILNYFRVFLNIIFRKQNQDPDLVRLEVKKSLCIRGRRLLQVQADGDLLGYTPVEVKLAPSAIGIIVPE